MSKWPYLKDLSTLPEALMTHLQVPNLDTIRCCQIIKRSNQTFRPSQVLDLASGCQGKTMKKSLIFYVEPKADTVCKTSTMQLTTRRICVQETAWYSWSTTILTKESWGKRGKCIGWVGSYIGNLWCKKETTVGEVAVDVRKRLDLVESEKLDAWEEITVLRQDGLDDGDTLADAELGRLFPFVSLPMRHWWYYRVPESLWEG